MISWLQNNFQKHYRVLFVVLLAVVIVAFVFTIGAAPGIGRSGDERLQNLSFFDTELNTESKRQAFFDAAQLSNFIQMGRLSAGSASMQDYAFRRAAAIHLANLHGIPQPTEEQLETYVLELPAFQSQEGNFDAEAYQRFLDNIDINPAFSRASLSRVLAEDYRIEQVRETLAGPGYSLEERAVEELRSERTTWSVLVATIPLDRFNPEIEIDEDALRQYFETNALQYATPPRRSVSYARFDPESYLDDVPDPSEETLREHYRQNRSRYRREAQAPEAQAGEETALSFEEARSQVLEDYRREEAKRRARVAAENLVLELIETDVESGQDRWREIVAATGRKLRSAEPFARSETPMDANLGRRVVKAAFRLTPQRFYSEPIEIAQGYVVLFLEDEIPESVPPFEVARDQVEEDYKARERRRRRLEAAEALARELREAAGSEIEFGAAAETRGLAVERFAEFTRREPPTGLDRSLIGALDGLEEGDASELLAQGEEARLLYVAQKDPPELDASAEEVAARVENLRSQYLQAAANQFIDALVQQELARSGLLAAQNLR